MKSVSDMLREADPLRHEPMPGAGDRERIRRAVLTASGSTTPALTRFRASVAVMAVVAAILIAIAALGSRTGPRGSATVYAAVRFEVRLGEEQPGADRRAAKLAGSDRVIYLLDEVVVTNGDIARSAVAPGATPSTFNIGIRFNEAGAEKMRRATADHLGKPIAVLIDGEVVMAPTLRSPVSDSALISGDFSQAEAERIVNGISGR
jgi:SecDF, P1 head subdomain